MRNTKQLYESIMRDVSKIIKKYLNEDLFDELYDIEDLKNNDTEIANEISKTTKEQLRKDIEKQLDIQGPNADLNDLNIHGVTDMSHLFEGLKINYIKINEWDVSEVTDMSYMFKNCFNFTVDYNYKNTLGKWNVSNVKDMSCMFNNCYDFSGDGLKYWDVSNVENMYMMFNNCYRFHGDLSKWNINNVTNTCWMFNNCYKFNCYGLENWKISNIANTHHMFDNIDFKTQIPSWYKE